MGRIRRFLQAVWSGKWELRKPQLARPEQRREQFLQKFNSRQRREFDLWRNNMAMFGRQTDERARAMIARNIGMHKKRLLDSLSKPDRNEFEEIFD